MLITLHAERHAELSDSSSMLRKSGIKEQTTTNTRCFTYWLLLAKGKKTKNKMDRDEQSRRVMRKLNSNMFTETIYLSETTDM